MHQAHRQAGAREVADHGEFGVGEGGDLVVAGDYGPDRPHRVGAAEGGVGRRDRRLAHPPGADHVAEVEEALHPHRIGGGPDHHVVVVGVRVDHGYGGPESE